MEPHQQRVVAERNELDERLAKLEEFRDYSPIFKGLSKAEQRRLVRQASYMELYRDVLDERIEAFEA